MRDPRLVDDTPDPMERGGLIHSVLQEIYSAISRGESGIDTPRCWAVKTASGWMRRTEDGIGAVPLAVFVPERETEYVEFARKVAERRMDQEALGHPGVWAAEREKVLEMVLNFIRYDAETCASENRYPALFELRFGGESAVDLGVVRLHGIIDRVDLIFAETGALKKLRVLDYKGSSRERKNPEEYMDEIRRNLDCQLPVYAFAAQQYFFGESNTEPANTMTEVGYLLYQRKYSEIKKTLAKSLLSMDEPQLVGGFIAALTDNIRKLKSGDFAVDPMISAYNDYRSVCRTDAVAREDLE